LLRHAIDGSASGLSPLVLLPVVWLALYETRREVATSLVLAAGTIVGPLVIVGAPAYTAVDWRKAVVMTSVSALAAFVVSRAVEELAAQTRAAEELADRLAISEATQRRIAEYDGLTGAANRRALDQILAGELPVRGDAERAVLMIDFDRFKVYNDSHGHAAGDLLLKEGVARWRDILRDRDVVARYGGEEFVVLLRGCSPIEVDAVADRLRLATPAGQSVSIGLACARPEESADELLARADRALYAAKRSGRNRVVRAD
jgi:diguanylate cyclase